MVWCVSGAVQLIAYFFGVAPAVGAPSSFNIVFADVGRLVGLVGW